MTYYYGFKVNSGEYKLMAAKEQAEVGFFREFWGFLRDNKKWSLRPILIVLVLFSVLIILSGTGLAPLIYTLF